MKPEFLPSFASICLTMAMRLLQGDNHGDTLKATAIYDIFALLGAVLVIIFQGFSHNQELADQRSKMMAMGPAVHRLIRRQ